MANLKLSDLQVRVLRLLPIDNPTSTTFGVSPQVFSRAVRRLEQRGFVRLVKENATAHRAKPSLSPRAQRTVRIESTGVG